LRDERIIEFTYRPKTESRRIMPTVLTLAAVSAVLVVLSIVAPVYRGLISLAAVIGICVSMYLFLRYCAGDFVYSVTEDTEGEAILTVMRVIGKRASTVFMMHLSEISEIKIMSEAEKSKHAPAPDAKKYNFCPSYSPERVCLIKFSSRTERCECFIECTDEVAARLREYALYAKETEREE